MRVMNFGLRRRGALAVAALLLLWAAPPAPAAAPTPAVVTPELVEAAKKEGTVIWYTSIELQTAEKLAKSFEAAYPGIKVQVERNGAERNFQRIAQERGSDIHMVDAAEASDMGSFILWKRQAGWRRSCPRMLPRNGRPTSATRMASTPRFVSTCRRSSTTPA
jgi:iron(III) transport system substrate-binding protein